MLWKKRYLCFTTAFSSKCFGESLHYIEGAFDAFAVLWTGVSIRPLHTKPVNLNKWAIISLKSGIFYTLECFFLTAGSHFDDSNMLRWRIKGLLEAFIVKTLRGHWHKRTAIILWRLKYFDNAMHEIESKTSFEKVRNFTVDHVFDFA